MWGKRLLALAGIILLPGSGFLIARELPFFRLSEEKALDYLEKGLYHYNSRNFVAAREYFYRSLEAKSDLHLARRFLGDSYYFTGDYESALEQWESLLEASGPDLMIEDRLNLIQHTFTGQIEPGPYRFYGWIHPQKRTFAPVDIQADEKENIFVLCFDPPGIYQFRPAFQQVLSEGRSPDFDEAGILLGRIWDRMKGPVAFQLYQNRFYIADFAGDRIYILEKDGRYGGSFGSSGSAEGQFRGPSGIAVVNDMIYVADQGNRRLQKFDLQGNFLAAWRPEGLQKPSGIASDGRHIAVSDAAGAIVILDEDGLLVRQIAGPELKRPSGLDWRGNRLFIADEKTGPQIYDLEEGSFVEMPVIRDENDRVVTLERAVAFRSDSRNRLYIANGKGSVLHLTREAALRSGYDVTFYQVESSSYPDIAFTIRVVDRSSGRDAVVRGLTEENFMVFENGSRIHPIRVDGMDRFQNRMNLVIIKENSTAFARYGLDEFLDTGMRDILSGIRVSDRLQLFLADSRTTAVYRGLERRQLLARMHALPPVEDPAIGRAIYDGITDLLDRKGPAGVLLVVSGRSFPSAFDRYDPTVLVQYARAHSIPVHVLSFEAGMADGDTGASDIYRRISADTGGYYVRFFDETERKRLYERMTAIKDPRYIITYRSPGRALRGRYMDVSVQVHHRKTTGASDGGYVVP
jgi:hypothetical protein